MCAAGTNIYKFFKKWQSKFPVAFFKQFFTVFKTQNLLKKDAPCLIFFLSFLISSCSTLYHGRLQVRNNGLLEAEYKKNNAIKKLINKNDSLKNSGLIYDSVWLEQSQKLAVLNSASNTDLRRLQYIKQTLAFKVGYKEQFHTIKKTTASEYNNLDADVSLNENLLNEINARLDSGLLGGEKKKLKSMLNAAAAQQKKEAQKLTSLGSSKTELTASGKIPDLIGQRLDERFRLVEHRADSINAEIKKLGQQLDLPVSFSKNFVSIKTKILLIDSVVNKNAGIREYLLTMIEDGMTKSDPKVFNLAAFFGAGGYIIPQEKYATARQYFYPVLDSLIKFSNAYATVDRTATIIVNGYADASRISAGTALHKVVSAYIGNINATRQELNTGLSALRSEEISRLLSKMVKERSAEFLSVEKVVFQFVEKGEGEKLPNKNIKDYKANDDRRRIVIIAWNALPNQ